MNAPAGRELHEQFVDQEPIEPSKEIDSSGVPREAWIIGALVLVATINAIGLLLA